ncbi:hypothetical protein HC251_18970 [Iamia sp. SCSIO 61187]|uniref:hypothetical protein n=1 Tax=Iamia sp. SCSIO 61187 TaxID=2722752 RepID=UPI001C63976F|nr:hypothetical protein [Iamia sp. SCSIO 61187]QYG94310.1 hypothetical protein HC251_18970 [Iamia sp. SCSIO 61187]
MTDPGAHPWPQPTAEGAHATFHVAGWRYMGAEVAYERTMVVGGRPLLFAALAGASALSNRRRREEAARLAAPRWRPLGDVTVVVAEDRLLVLHEGVWASVWLDAINAVHSPHDSTVTLLFVDDPPYAFSGAWAGHLASALDRALADRHHEGRATVDA